MHTIIKSKFLSIIKKKPALFRELVDPTPELIALCLSENYKVLRFLDISKKHHWLSPNTLKAYLNLRLSMINRASIYGYQESSIQEVIKAFHLSVRKLIEPDLLTRVINWTPYFIKLFPQADYNMWKSALSINECTNISANDIPTEFLNDELKKLYLINANSYNRTEDNFWSNAIVDDVLQAHPSYINYIPSELWNTTRLRSVLSLEEDGDPVQLERDIPLVLCDDDIAEKATEHNYSKIPVEYRSWDRSMRAVIAYGSYIQDVPSKILDLAITVEAMAKCQPEDIPEKFMSHKGFLYTIAERDYADYINNAPLPQHYQQNNTNNPRYCLRLQKFLRRARSSFGDGRNSSLLDEDILNGKDRAGNKIYYNPKYFSWDMWPDVLKHCPAAIRLIPKEYQTEEMLTQFFKNGNTTFSLNGGTRSTTVIAELANFLHIGKIKKSHADLLTSDDYANVESTLLQEVIQRKFKKGPQIRPEPVIPVETVTVNITDSVYRSLDEEYHVTVPEEPRIQRQVEPDPIEEEIVEEEPILVPVVRTANPHRRILRLTPEE